MVKVKKGSRTKNKVNIAIVGFLLKKETTDYEMIGKENNIMG